MFHLARHKGTKEEEKKITTNQTNNTNSYFDSPLLFVKVRDVRGKISLHSWRLGVRILFLCLGQHLFYPAYITFEVIVKCYFILTEALVKRQPALVERFQIHGEGAAVGRKPVE